MKIWSFSTTVRNPERLRDFLKVLKKLEGYPFNSENQIKFQILLIKNKLYTPSIIPQKYNKYFQKLELEIPYNIAEEVFHLQKYRDPPMRGRQSVNPLNKLGFCIARNNIGKIKITDLGNIFLQDNYDIGYIFYKSLLKLQFPNPWSRDFTEKYNFNVVPFITAMHLFWKVNELTKKQGLSQAEFSLFIPTLINFNLIDKYVDKIIKYRKAKNKKKFKFEFAKEFYKVNFPSEKQVHNFTEYGDNIMRYFKLTRYFKIKKSPSGYGWRILLEPARKIEIKQIINKYSGEAIKFKNIDQYIKYIADISLPVLPSEKIDNLQQINKSLIFNIIEFTKKNDLKLSDKESKLIETRLDNLNIKQMQRLIVNLRNLNLRLKNSNRKRYLQYNIKEAKNIIKKINDIKAIKRLSPEELEKVISDALKIINDEIEIKPNYPVDDDGEPISHAPGNKADIECFYKSFNAICEVTLDTSSYQWIRETQPVMRHLRTFENKYNNKDSYCLFIAPRIHTDTLGQFWFSIKSGYDGKKQKIVPLTTNLFVSILEIISKAVLQQKPLKHEHIQLLYNKIINKTNSVTSHNEWLESIKYILDEWQRELLN